MALDPSNSSNLEQLASKGLKRLRRDRRPTDDIRRLQLLDLSLSTSTTVRRFVAVGGSEIRSQWDALEMARAVSVMLLSPQDATLFDAFRPSGRLSVCLSVRPWTVLFLRVFNRNSI